MEEPEPPETSGGHKLGLFLENRLLQTFPYINWVFELQVAAFISDY